MIVSVFFSSQLLFFFFFQKMKKNGVEKQGEFGLLQCRCIKESNEPQSHHCLSLDCFYCCCCSWLLLLLLLLHFHCASVHCHSLHAVESITAGPHSCEQHSSKEVPTLWKLYALKRSRAQADNGAVLWCE